MSIHEKDGIWRKRVAGGVLLVVIAPAAAVVLANTLGFLLPFYVSAQQGEEVHDPESLHAFIELAMSWIGLISVLFTIPLLVGVWKSTPASALERPREMRRFRFGLRALASVYAVALGAKAALRFLAAEEGRTALGWIAHAFWWAFVLLGLAYVGKLFVRLGEDRLARRSRLVAVAYVVLVASSIALFEVRDSALGGRTEDKILLVTLILAAGLLLVVSFVILASLLWKLRKALLRQEDLARTPA